MIIIFKTKDRLSPILGVAWSFCVFLFIYLIKFPTDARAAVIDSLKVCTDKLIPSLFLSMVLTNFVYSTDFVRLIPNAVTKVFHKLTGLSGSGVSAFILGAVCGFPTGVAASKKLVENNKLTKKEATYLIGICNNPSIAFCVGTVGELFGNKKIGLRLWGIQLISAAIIAVSQRKKIDCADIVYHNKAKVHPSIRKLLGLFVDSVSDASLSMLKICAFTVFFGVVGEITAKIFPTVFAAIINSFLELTKAADMSSRLGHIGIPICAFALGFGGMSVHSQSAALLSDSGISMKRYFASKFIQGMLSALIAVIFC